MKLELTRKKAILTDTEGHEVSSTSAEAFVLEAIKLDTPAMPIGIMPPRLVWLSDDHLSVIFERPPFVTHMEFHYGKAGAKGIEKTVYDIPLPWTVYAVSFTPEGDVASIRIFARNTPITSVNDSLGVLPIPNMNINAEACLGPGFQKFYNEPFNERKEKAKKARVETVITLAERLGHAVNTFWNGTFNMDYAWTEEWKLPTSIPQEIKDEGNVTIKAVRFLEWWQTQSKIDAASMDLSVSNTFGLNGDTVEQLIERLTVFSTGNKLGADLKKNPLTLAIKVFALLTKNKAKAKEIEHKAMRDDIREDQIEAGVIN